MTQIPAIDSDTFIYALQRDVWGFCPSAWQSYIRMQKQMQAETLKLTIPVQKPIQRSALSHILKQAHLAVEELNRLL